ncbi:MAG: hypothetical protein WA705_29215 [Candidatus Ozemobacteraceae bacterium]
MSTSSSSLSLCLRAAERIELAVERLGPSWSGHGSILQACHEFCRACEQLATNRGFSEITLAFVGPKKAGKSSVAGMLIDSEEKRIRLKTGQKSDDSTAKPTWVAAQRPALFDSAKEDFIPCHESELVPLGFRYALLDVPGSNERDPARRESAIRALDYAVVKVLVADRRTIESGEIMRYLEGTVGAPVIPVVNQIRHDEDGADFATWEDSLRQRLPSVLPRVEIRDWDIGSDGKQKRADARQALVQRITEAVAGHTPETLAEPQLGQKLRVFENDMADLARKHLPVTAVALNDLYESFSKLPAKAVEELLGSDRLIAANVRYRFRSILLEQTPIFLFPWRLALSIANLVHGATDRLPLVLLGSIPSLLTTAWTATKNVKEAREFAEEAVSGLRTRVTVVIKELAGPQLQTIDYALQRDLGLEAEVPPTSVSSTANLRGLETFQASSAKLFQEITEKYAPGSFTAWFLGFVGVAIFWGIFGCPIYGLYQDFFVAATDVFARQRTALAAFPTETFSMLLTSAVLATLPMVLFLLCTLAFFTRRKNACACIQELRAAHEAELQRLTDSGQIEVEISEPRIDACCTLLRIGKKR